MKKNLLSLAVSALLLSGCGGNVVVPKDNFYRLPALAPSKIEATPLLSGTLAINTLTADPVHRDRALLVSNDPKGLRLQQVNYHNWIDNAPEMVREYLRSYLTQAQVAKRVGGTDALRNANYEVTGRLLRFERHSAKGVETAQVTLRLALLESRGEETLFEHTYNASQALTAEQHLAGVIAFQQALAEILDAFIADIKTL